MPKAPMKAPGPADVAEAKSAIRDIRGILRDRAKPGAALSDADALRLIRERVENETLWDAVPDEADDFDPAAHQPRAGYYPAG